MIADTRVIIDAIELFIEKPTSPCAQKAAWSDHKHHNTVKLIVEIAPNGAFTFMRVNLIKTCNLILK